MRHALSVVFGVLLVSALYCEQSLDYPKIRRLTSIDDRAFPFLQYSIPQNSIIESPFEGRSILNAGLPGEFGDVLVIDQKQEYELYGKKQVVAFWIVLYNFELTEKGISVVKKNQIIGKAKTTGMKLAVCADRVDSYLSLMSSSPPVHYADRYWFYPSFMLSSGATAYLSFRAVDDFAKALEHVASEAVSDPGYVFYNDYKVRFLTSLETYPRDLSDVEKDHLRGFEQQYYGKTGILKFGTDFEVNGFKYILCWQDGFDKYLKDEYKLGKSILIFGGIVTYDVWNKVGYVFIRDFLLRSLEDIVEGRIKSLKN